jgi:hypothetical protein
LLLDGERKNIQPMAVRLTEDPASADAMRQRLPVCVSASQWSEVELQRRFALRMDRELPDLEMATRGRSRCRPSQERPELRGSISRPTTRLRGDRLLLKRSFHMSPSHS